MKYFHIIVMINQMEIIEFIMFIGSQIIFHAIFREFLTIFKRISLNLLSNLNLTQFLSRLQTLCKTLLRCEKPARCDNVYGLFHIFYAVSRDRFLTSHVSNYLVIESVIMHKTKGFSHAAMDKIIVRENNRITKCR